MTTAVERHIRLDESVNFRDLGGYETAEGKRLRWRTLFRADGLSRLTDNDRGIVRRLGVATVIDLRTTSELEGGRFPVEDIPVAFHHLPLLDELPDPDRFNLAPGMLSSSYRHMVDNAGPQIAEVLSILARPGAHPAIVHCTAGKDRTGVLIAVLLGLLGVSDDIIVEDYALSAMAMARLREKLTARYPDGRETIERANEMFSASPDNIRLLLGTLRERFGSLHGYAADIGVSPETVAGLRSELLE